MCPFLPVQECYDACQEFQAAVMAFDRLCLEAARFSSDVDEEQVVEALKDLLFVRLDKVLSTVKV